MIAVTDVEPSPSLPQASPPAGSRPRLFHCAGCYEPLGLVLLGKDSRVERRCRKCKKISGQVGMRESFLIESEALPFSTCIRCLECHRVLGKGLLALGSFYQPRCRHCHKTTAVVGPHPIPQAAA